MLPLLQISFILSIRSDYQQDVTGKKTRLLMPVLLMLCSKTGSNNPYIRFCVYDKWLSSKLG